MIDLRRLDDRLLPVAARAMQRLSAALRSRAGRFRAAPSPAPAPPPASREGPVGPAPFILRLRQVDDRYARSGALALLRDVPQLGAVLLATLLLVSATTVAVRSSRPDPSAPPDGPGLPGGVGRTLVGPTLGERVGPYVVDAGRRLVRQSVGAPDAEAYAVVSFHRHQTVAQVRAALSSYDVVQVFVRVLPPPRQAELRPVPVGDVAAIPTELARIARDLRAEAAELRRVSATIDNDPQQKEFNERTAGELEVEAGKLSRGCACLVGAVVRAKLRRLRDLAREPAVRLVDAAPARVALNELEFRPLLPDETVTVTQGNEDLPDG